jgi:hypothetical protein
MPRSLLLRKFSKALEKKEVHTLRLKLPLWSLEKEGEAQRGAVG